MTPQNPATVIDPLTSRTYPVPAGGSGEGEGGDPEPEGEGEGGQESPLEQQALAAIEDLREAGADIPEALEAAVSEFRNARSEAAERRTELREVQERVQELEGLEGVIDGMAEVLGVSDDEEGGSPDPDELQSTVSELESTVESLRSENRRMRLADVVGRVARSQGADSEITYAYLSSRNDLSDLDLDGDDLESTVEERVLEALEAKPQLASSGNGTADQGPRRAAKQRPADLSEALREHINS